MAEEQPASVFATTTQKLNDISEDQDELPGDENDRRSSLQDSGLQKSTRYKSFRKTAEKETKRFCFPDGFSIQWIPLCVGTAALFFTGAGSWDCTYFAGADIAFTGKYYGLWTLEDSSGKCQLWDVLFFSYDLGGALTAARVFSMTAMLVGLGLVAAMAQATQVHLFSWTIGLFLMVVFIVSAATTSIFNVWAIFFWFTYIIMILIVRFLLRHPVPRRIGQRGSRIMSGFCGLCAVCCFLTLVVLKSDFCTCAGLSADRLEDRDVGEPCEGTCSISAAAILMILAGVLWFMTSAAILVCGIQPKILKKNLRRPSYKYANYPQQSIVTRFRGGMSSLTGGGSKDEDDNIKGIEVVAKKDDEPSDLALTTIGGEVGPEEDLENSPTSTIEGASISKDNDEVPHRRRCQKCCCDFYILERSRKERFYFWGFRTALIIICIIYFAMIFMLIGSRVENTKAAKKPSTDKFFTTAQVCAYDSANPWDTFQTFDTKEEAKALNLTVAHCGACAECSNPHDIQVYVETRNTIATKSKKCGVQVFLGTKSDLNKCLKKKIGFTKPCTSCWADNMITTGEKCLSTCMRTLFSGFMTDNNVAGAGDSGWLNSCLYCDEKNSGPAFVTCSGVARRRLGIVSEIVRNPELQCKNMDVDWVTVDFKDIGFDTWPNGSTPIY